MLTKNEINTFVKPYIKEGKKPAIYQDTLDIYNHLRFHIDGYKYTPGKVDNPYFETLIEKRRPNESEAIKKYRKEIYLPKTKQPCFKVLNSFKKIVKSQDWKIDYSKAENPPIVGEETLEQYCEHNYPIFNSLENWLYSYGIKEVITDPNGLVYVEPKNWDIPDGEKYEPIAKFVKTPNILCYKEGEVAFFKSEKINTVTVSGQKYDLPVYILITPSFFAYVKEYDLERNYTIEVKSETFQEMPVIKAGGVFSDYKNGEAIYESFISPMLPSLDAVAREVSDLDAEVVQHIYSQFWYYSGNDCRTCNGTGKVIKNGEPTACDKCEGNGRLLKSPYKDIVIGKDGLGENGVPTPPAGYIQKTTEIVTLQDTRIKNHIYDALASLNMEFLAQTPLNESGTAKEVDRDELNNFVYGVAYHLIENVLNKVYKFISDERYGVLVTDDKKRSAMLPSVNIPEKYDLLSTNVLIENFKKSKEAQISASIINEYEVDIINKLFNNQPETRDKLLLIKELDPLRGIDDEEKVQLFNNGVISKEDFVASSYVDQFVGVLLNKYKDFATQELDQQKAEFNKLVEEKVKELDQAQKVKNELFPPEPPAPGKDDEDEDEPQPNK